ncbi:MAG: TonB-dependent receptor [Gemmatimonadales bacterium]
MQPRAFPLSLVGLFIAGGLAAQDPALRGVVRQRGSGTPIGHAVVAWEGAPGSGALTGSDGRFRVARIAAGARLVVMAIGYRPDTIPLRGDEPVTAELEPAPLTLAPLVVAAARSIGADLAVIVVRDLELALKAPSSSQELLRLAPGLVIAQHAGGGKAEQIFLRGFDADHGTDVAVSVDQVPVNLVSHAHGHGYADLHFVMPEVVEQVEVRKGGHDPADGNLATAGAVRLVTKDRIDRAVAWGRGGSFGMATLGGLVPFGGGREAGGGFLGLSGQYADGPFQRSQGHRRLNGYGKWTRPVSEDVEAVVAVSGYRARWDASGQVPDRAVRAGLIDRFGAIDPTEGGITGRADLVLGLRSWGGEAADWQLRAYATRYRLDLYSNFTFFLADSVRGDGIAQFDDRTVLGANGEWRRATSLLGVPGRSAAGFSVRSDVAEVELAGQTARRLTTTRLASAISEQNGGLWVRHQFRPTTSVGIDLGVRADLFRFDVAHRGGEGEPAPRGREWAGRVSPKVSLSAEVARGMTAFAAASASFHSNDARDVVLAADSVETLPRAVTVEAGLRAGWSTGTIALSAWRTDLESELVFVGDEGVTEPSGRTRRLGLDLEARARLLGWLWADGDLNLVRGRLRDEPPGAAFIPLAPGRTAMVGLVARGEGPLAAGFRLRHIGDRPADETGAITALGATLAELTASVRLGRMTLSAVVDNLFDVRWNEAQFATTSRLRGEAAAVTELHYTPGAPRRFELGLRMEW